MVRLNEVWRGLATDTLQHEELLVSQAHSCGRKVHIVDTEMICSPQQTKQLVGMPARTVEKIDLSAA